MFCPYQLSEDGIETQFATNHIGWCAIIKRVYSTFKENMFFIVSYLKSYLFLESLIMDVEAICSLLNRSLSFNKLTTEQNEANG